MTITSEGTLKISKHGQFTIPKQFREILGDSANYARYKIIDDKLVISRIQPSSELFGSLAPGTPTKPWNRD